MIHIPFVVAAAAHAAAHAPAAHVVLATTAAHTGAAHAALATTAAHAHAGVTATVLGTRIATSTVGGVIFVNALNNVLNDAYKQLRRGLSRWELGEIISEVSRDSLAKLKARGILVTRPGLNEMNWLGRQTYYALAG